MDLYWLSKVSAFKYIVYVCHVIAFLPRSKRLLISWMQVPDAVILKAKKIKSVIVFIVSPICLSRSNGTGHGVASPVHRPLSMGSSQLLPDIRHGVAPLCCALCDIAAAHVIRRVQGAVAVRVQEGLEERFHVQCQEGQW